MEEEVDRICNKIRPKVKALLRTRAFYCTRDMLTQYKTHIWPHLENTIGAYFHAANSHLLKLDGVQIGYLHSLGLDAAVAFSEFNFTSTRLRRCIGTLGLLHKCTLGLEHEGISQFFQPAASSDTYIKTRSMGRRHSKQLVDHCGASSPDYLLRSMLGMTYVYNLLPQNVVRMTDVNSFQTALTDMAKVASCATGFEKLYCHIDVRRSDSLRFLRHYQDIYDACVRVRDFGAKKKQQKQQTNNKKKRIATR